MSSDSKARTNINTKLIRELADILRDTELTEIEVERGDLRVRVARQGQPMAVVQAAPVAATAFPSPASMAPETPAPMDATDMSAHPGVVKSPMVGSAYLRSSPDVEPFVKVGDTVKKGDTVLLVEAMKTFNPILADKSGKISEILVEEGQPVEYGEPLFILV
jgi:acetyl-CoA carboxylase biotin carboxyl carrier protein